MPQEIRKAPVSEWSAGMRLPVLRPSGMRHPVMRLSVMRDA
jgi:hypothetical protein